MIVSQSLTMVRRNPILGLNVSHMIHKERQENEYQKNPDDTHRLFYVACTRTENNLFIIEPQRKKAYDI